MFVEYLKINETCFTKFITGNFVDLSDQQNENNVESKYIQLVGVSEYRFTLFIIKYYKDQIEKFVELFSKKSVAIIQNIEKIEHVDGNTNLDGILVIYQPDIPYELFCYDIKQKNFAKLQDFYTTRKFQSLLRKTGYLAKSLDDLTVLTAYLSNFAMVKFNKPGKSLEEKELFFQMLATTNCEKYSFKYNEKINLDILPKVKKLQKKTEDFIPPHDWEDLQNELWYIEDLNIFKADKMITQSFLHKKKTELYLTSLQFDKNSMTIHGLRVYEKQKNGHSLYMLSINEPYLLYMSQAKQNLQNKSWPGYVIFSVKQIQFIHESKYDFLQLNLPEENSIIVYVAKMSETNFLLFLDTGEVYLVAIESRIDLSQIFSLKPLFSKKSDNYEVRFQVFLIAKTQFDVLHINEQEVDSKTKKFLILCNDKVQEMELDFEKGIRNIKCVHNWNNNFIESIVI